MLLKVFQKLIRRCGCREQTPLIDAFIAEQQERCRVPGLRMHFVCLKHVTDDMDFRVESVTEVEFGKFGCGADAVTVSALQQ